MPVLDLASLLNRHGRLQQLAPVIPTSLFITELVDVNDLDVPWSHLVIWWGDIHGLDAVRTILLLTV